MPRDYDYDNENGPRLPFYTTAEPCESCGEPTFKGRVWNAEHELWIATDCSCNLPDRPTCPLLIPLLEKADTVREVCQVIRQHRKTCPKCGPQPISVTRLPEAA